MTTMPSLDPRTQISALKDAQNKARRMVEGPAEPRGARSDAVSGWSVGQHLFHVLKANGYALKNALRISSGEEHRLVMRDADVRDETLKILRSGKIPRGLAEAPTVVTPPPDPPDAELRALADLADELTGRVSMQLPSADLRAGFIAHPLLGPMDGRMWLRFARIHTEHHLAIIDEILAAAGA